ncbi:MAG: hypothetical protein PHI11_02075 [Gallionella sp.]|nr:hypothetical protein [Gallionella sp.]
MSSNSQFKNIIIVIPTKVGIQPKINPRSEQNRCSLATRGIFKRLDTDFRRYDGREIWGKSQSTAAHWVNKF